jgi:hypothetical protein
VWECSNDRVSRYTVLWSWDFFLRNIAVAGSLVLLYTETVMENKNSRTGGGLLHDSAMKSEDYLLGVARVMVSIMFLTMMKFDSAGDSPLVAPHFSGACCQSCKCCVKVSCVVLGLV